MAQSEHLPIYKTAYDLCLYLEQVVKTFARYHAFTLGADLRNGSRRVLTLVVRANSRDDKVPLLLELREEVEALKVVLRLCADVKAFQNFRSFEHAITQAVEIAKQNEGWLKSSRRSPRAPSALRSAAAAESSDPPSADHSENQGHGRNRQGMPERLPAPGEPRSRGLSPS